MLSVHHLCIPICSHQRSHASGGPILKPHIPRPAASSRIHSSHTDVHPSVLPKKLAPHAFHTFLRRPIVVPRAAAASSEPHTDGLPDSSSQEQIPSPPPPAAAGLKQNNHASEQNRDEEEEQVQPRKQANNTLKLGVIFGLWYFQNVVFNIYNKKVLNAFPYPWLLASFQLLAGSLWMAALWLLRLYPFPRISKPFFMALLIPALFHTVGHISACVSFSKVAVSFTHVIKASEPVFSVALSALYGTFYPLRVWLAVLPIVAGCSLAAVTELSFHPAGLWGALISNVGFVLRNIYSKQSLRDFKHIDGLNLYGFISIVSLVYLFPAAVLVEGSQWSAGFKKAMLAVPSPRTFFIWVLLSGVFYHLYNQTSYQALDEISPLSFSVGNTMKRVVVIVASVLVFRNPIRPLNALGSAIAIFGTFLYSQATAIGRNKTKEEGVIGVADEKKKS